MLYKTFSFITGDKMPVEASGIPAAFQIASKIIDLLKKDVESFYDEHQDFFKKIEEKALVKTLNVNDHGCYSVRQTIKDISAQYISTPKALNSVTSDLNEFNRIISDFLKKNQHSHSLNCCSSGSPLIPQQKLTKIKSLLVDCQNKYQDFTDYSQS